MNAIEARSLAESKLKGSDYVLKSIETMAEAGYFEAAFSTSKLIYISETCMLLEEKGFHCTLTSDHLIIKW